MKAKEFNELYGRYLDTSGIPNKKLNVAYGPHERNKLDIYYPDQGTGPWPVVVFYHGGGFFKGDKGRYQLKPALAGLERGYAVVSVNYRLAPADLLPAAYQDARSALRYLRANAGELELDRDRMALWGESAGACLACFTGLVKQAPLLDDPAAPYAGESCEVRAVVDWYASVGLPASQLVQRESGLLIEGKNLREYAFGKSGEELYAAMEQVDPCNYLGEGIPPVFIEHGLADTVVPVEASLKFREKLLRYLPEEQVPIYLMEGAEHGVEAFETPENLARVFSFLDRCLGK